jgi:hypothetical protein
MEERHVTKGNGSVNPKGDVGLYGNRCGLTIVRQSISTSLVG